ncbi:MAG: hypothetical protein QGG36_30050, partial [Pirellulaceae bacterium]|nr:hypothetical protein [Pirellulaceae bacterium]
MAISDRRVLSYLESAIQLSRMYGSLAVEKSEESVLASFFSEISAQVAVPHTMQAAATVARRWGIVKDFQSNEPPPRSGE